MAHPQPTTLGAHETVEILKQLPIGLLVRLDDGRKGIVREREIAWDASAQREWRTRIQPGETQPAVVIKDDGAQLELSLRLAVADPWLHVEEKYLLGSCVTGWVSGLTDTGVYVELEPGVAGLLDQSQLPDWNRQDIKDLFWIGDKVRAEVLRVDSAHREISLCLKNVLNWRWPVDGSDGDGQRIASRRKGDSQDAPAPRLPLEILATRGAQSVLVIEDDGNQNQAICGRLRRTGHHVEGALDADQAFDLLAQQAFDVVLSDVGLPGKDGIEILRQVRQEFPQAHAFLMTDWVTADQRNEAIAELEAQGVRLLLKPLAQEDLLHIFTDDAPTVFHSVNQPLATVDLPSATDGKQASIQERLHQGLEVLRYLTRASQAVLFVLLPDRRQIEVLDHCGRGRLNQQATVHLLHSPVREAAEDHKLVQVQDSQQQTGYVRYLLPLLLFRSCLGAPVPGDLAGQHAVFLFSPQADAFDDVAERLIRAGALALGALLEQQAAMERMADMQRTLLVGHLTRALVHEANHQLSPIVFSLEELQSQCARVERSIGGSPADAMQEMEETRRALRSLSLSLQNLMRTTRMFGRITVQDDTRMVRVDQVLTRCLELLEDMADRAHVVLELEQPGQIFLTKAKETLIQQVLLNLLLNAVQQTALTRPATGGRVRAAIHKQASGQGTVIRVTVEDDGPGIHRSQWQRIFDLGMTTRKAEGSGLGLYLARSLCQEIHGRVFVEDSAILWGTRFVVEFPVAL